MALSPFLRKVSLTAHITFSVGWFGAVAAFLAIAITGLVQSLGTNWGLFRYYWVLVKFLLTLLSTILLFLHLQPISYLAAKASETGLSYPDLRDLRIQLIADAGAALLVLLIIISISIFKPWGRTRFGILKQAIAFTEGKGDKPWRLYITYGLIGLIILIFIVFHLHKGGIKHH